MRDPLLPPAFNGPFTWLAAATLLFLAALAGFGGTQAGTEDFARLEALAAERYGPQAAARVRNWRDLLVSAASLDERRQIRRVNEFFNRNVLYQSDEELWGTPDYWATPLETLGRAGGDCEDYAIAKYVSLRLLGVPDDRLRLAVVQDELRNLAHAVLVVYKRDTAVVLDNLTNAVLPHDRLVNYTPYYTVNATTRWAHVPPSRIAMPAVGGTAGTR